MTPRARRRFAQHFLVDAAVIGRIIDAVDPGPNQRIVEIGPGRGALTAPLLARAGRLDAVEIDRDLAVRLAEKCRHGGRLNLLCRDALKLDFNQFSSPRLKVVGNLPYNVSTPLLFHLLRFERITRMVFMLQREVAERLCAPAGAADYGRLSVMAQARCVMEKLFDIAPGAFRPRPRVASSLVGFDVIAGGARRIYDYDRFAALVRTAFSARRKQVVNGLKPWADARRLEQLNIPATARPAELSVTDYINLANSLD